MPSCAIPRSHGFRSRSASRPDSGTERNGTELTSAAKDPGAPDAGGLELSALGDVRVLGRLGEGGRSIVYDAIWQGRPVALKVYKATAVVRHARKHPVPLAEFEHDRNGRFFRAPGLAPYVAEPLAWMSTPGVSATVQERLEGQLYYFRFQARDGRVEEELFGHVARIVELAHAASLYDVDLHAMNVMVVEGPDGQPWPKLFDFNLIPFHVRPPNPVVAFLLKAGLRSVRERDLRKLRRFHDFGRVERKLLHFYRD